MSLVNLVSYPTAFFKPGGGEVQLKATYDELVKINSNVRLLDYYNPEGIVNTSLFHLFSVYYSMELYVNAITENNLKANYVVSPIHWPIETEIKKYSKEWHRIRNILNNSSVILTNSDYESQLLDFYYDLNQERNNTFVKIVNGISEEYIKNKNIFKQNRTPNRKAKVLFCGNIESRKNLIELADACEKADFQLTIAGAIRDFDLYQNLIHFKNLSFHGEYKKNSKEHIDLITSHDVLCLPSFYETPGLVALEAAAIGIPIVITNVGSAQEYFLDNVFYCNPYDKETIIDGIEKSLNMGKLSKKFIDLVCSNYTWKKAAKKTNDIYRQFL